MSDRKDRIAIVTGASKGIGQSICKIFSERGYTVIGVSRQIKAGEFTRQCDVGDETSVKVLFDELIGTFGEIDILVNNAGISSAGDILTISMDEWERVLRTNLAGAFLCCKHVLGSMRERRYGRIINISSIAGRHRSSTASVAYTCSKYGIIGLTRQLAFDYGQYGININCVCPSQTRTPMLVEALSQEQIDAITSSIPSKRLAEPEEIAEVVYFLSSDAPSYLNGAVIDVNGGQF